MGEGDAVASTFVCFVSIPLFTCEAGLGEGDQFDVIAERLVFDAAAAPLLRHIASSQCEDQSYLARGAALMLAQGSAADGDTPESNSCGHCSHDPLMTWGASSERLHRLWGVLCSRSLPSEKLNAAVALCDAVVDQLGNPTAEELLPSISDSAARAVVSGHAPQLLASLCVAQIALRPGDSCSKAGYCFTTVRAAVQSVIDAGCGE